MWATSQDQGIYSADICLGFQFFKIMQTFAVIILNYFNLLRDLVVYIKPKSPTFILKLN